ncbi:MAG: hypothetical protein ACRD1T_21695 [Acidimicrobiia bacterium]
MSTRHRILSVAVAAALATLVVVPATAAAAGDARTYRSMLGVFGAERRAT